MISQVTIKNFKCLWDVTVNLERFTVFVGANGSGKTSFLQALDLLCRTFREQPRALNGDYAANRSHTATGEVEIACVSGGMEFRYRTPSIGRADDFHVGRTLPDDGAAMRSLDQNLGYWESWITGLTLLPNPVWLRLDPNKLRSPEGLDTPDYENDEYAEEPDPRLMLYPTRPRVICLRRFGIPTSSAT